MNVVNILAPVSWSSVMSTFGSGCTSLMTDLLSGLRSQHTGGGVGSETFEITPASSILFNSASTQCGGVATEHIRVCKQHVVLHLDRGVNIIFSRHCSKSLKYFRESLYGKDITVLDESLIEGLLTVSTFLPICKAMMAGRPSKLFPRSSITNTCCW